MSFAKLSDSFAMEICEHLSVRPNYLYRYNLSDTRILMTEAYASVEQTMAYYGNETHPGAHFTFNFNLVRRPTTAQDFDNLVHQWMDNVPKGMQSDWVVSNKL
jgi:alpha-glucosidase